MQRETRGRIRIVMLASRSTHSSINSRLFPSLVPSTTTTCSNLDITVTAAHSCIVDFYYRASLLYS